MEKDLRTSKLLHIFAPRLRENAGKGSLGEWLKPPVC